MSDIIFRCEHCGQDLSVEEDGAGLAVDCPTCNKQIIVPSLQTPEERLNPRLNSRSNTLVPPDQETPSDTQGAPLSSPPSTECHSATCSNCGAQLDIDENTETATCLFCGSKSLFNTPQDRLSRLRDLENPSLGVAYFTPSISFDQARQVILARIKSDECALRNADRIQMVVKGFYYPAWKVDVAAQSSWRGKDSHQEKRLRPKDIYCDGRKVGQEMEEYSETVWTNKSGLEFFTTTLLFPAGEGISPTQFNAVMLGTDGAEHHGHPARNNQFVIIPATKPQSRIWNEYNGDSLVNSHGWHACFGCAERLDGVSTTVQSRNFSLTYIPVAVVTYKANDTKYRHFVNLQTGQFSGDVPLDISKVANEGARATKEDQELKLTRIVSCSAMRLYIFVTCLLNMAWRDWDIVQAAISGAFQPFLAIFGENLERVDLLAGSSVLSITFSWVGWLFAFIFYKIVVPEGSPWLAFLVQRQAFLLRLTLSPPPQIAKMAIFSDPKFTNHQEGLLKAAEDNTLDSLPFEAAKPVTEVVANLLIETTPPAPTTQRFINTMITIGCWGLVLLFGTISYTSTVNNIRRLAVIEEQHQEQLAKEEQQRHENAAKLQQANETAERKRKAESARQMLSGSRFSESTFGVSYLPPKGWRRERNAADKMSEWTGRGSPSAPTMTFAFFRNDVDTLERAAENGFLSLKDKFPELRTTAESLGTTRFKTGTGNNGIKLLIKASTTQVAFNQVYYYIESDDLLFPDHLT